MNLKITEAARHEILKVTTPGHYMKVELQKIGCCNLAFTMYEDIVREGDVLIKVDDVSILVSKAAAEAVSTITIDYSKKNFRKEFRIIPE